MHRGVAGLDGQQPEAGHFPIVRDSPAAKVWVLRWSRFTIAIRDFVLCWINGSIVTLQ